MVKRRLDAFIQKKYPQYSLKQIQSWIMQGKVLVEGIVVIKAGTQVSSEVEIILNIEKAKYVSRAGFKLEKALEYFNISVSDLVVLDAGISTGGFSDCLLQKGAKRLYGVDVGYGQVHEKVYNDDRVVLLERTNLRNLRDVGQLVDLITLDLSFISILKVMSSVCAILKKNGQLITLIKPQFEAKRQDVPRGGIVKDHKVHAEVLNRITDGIKSFGFKLVGVIDSPISGATGNKEFLAYFRRIVDKK